MGSPLSGLITGILSWRWIFLINLPVGLFAIYFILTCLPKDLFNSSNNQNFDYIGAFLSFFSALSFTVFINQSKMLEINSKIVVGLFFISVISFILFVIRIFVSKNPLVNVKVFKNFSFNNANIAMFLVSVLLSGTSFLMPFYLSEYKNYSVLNIGLILMVYSLSYLLTSYFSGKIPLKIKSTQICILSMVLYLVNICFFIKMLDEGHLWVIITFLIITGISFSLFITSNNNFVMSIFEKGEVGMIAGIHRTVGRFGMLIGVAVFETVFSVSTKISFVESFKNAYILGLIVCIFALIFSIFSENKSVKSPFNR